MSGPIPPRNVPAVKKRNAPAAPPKPKAEHEKPHATDEPKEAGKSKTGRTSGAGGGL